VRRRRAELFEQPSLVPMADMVTNTVGIMLFILIFVSLSAGGVVLSRHLPRERRTNAKVIWMFCSHGRITGFDAGVLGKEFEKPLGAPSFDTARDWARRFSGHKLTTGRFEVAGEAVAESLSIRRSLMIRPRPGQGDDADAIKTPGSAFQRLLADKEKSANFFFFFVTPDSVTLFRTARDQLTQAGFGVGWSPLGADEPARISLSGGGREAMIQ
jgi:hypothetical protein